MSEELSIEIDKKTYAKLKKLADANECTTNEEVGNAFTAAYEDLDDSVFDEISIMEKRDSILLILPADLYDSFQEEADNNSTSIEDELNVFFEEHLTASGEEFEEDSGEYEEEEETEEESEDDEVVEDDEEESEESADDSSEESNEDEAEEDEAQSIVIDKETYINLKKLADANECSINEEIGKAFSTAYEDMDEETLEKIDVMPRKDMVYVLLPKDLYDSFQEEADKNSTEIEEELKVFFEEHLAASGEEFEEDSEEAEEEYEEEETEEADNDSNEEDLEEDEEKPRSKKTESKGLFGMLTDAVGDFVEDLISGEEDHTKKKNED